MRKIYKQLLIALLALIPVGAWAQTTFTQGDFTYTVTDEDAKTVSIAKAEAATLTGALVIPTSVTEAEVTYAVTAVGESGFNGTGITSVTVPASVMTIGIAAFQGCGSLASITIEDSETPLTMPGAWYERPFIENSATTFYIGRNLTLTGGENYPITYNATSVEFGPKVTTINPSLFYANSKLASITIGSGVTTIGESAFLACGQSDEVTETVVTMGSNVTSIGTNAFKDCTHIKSVTLPSKLTTIGNEAFNGSSLTSISIPASVTSIGIAAFQGCNSMSSITIEDSETPLTISGAWYERSFWNGATTIYIGRDLTLEGGENNPLLYEATSVEFGPQVTIINPALFYDNSKLASIIIGNGVTTIGESAFYRCGTYWDDENNQGVEELVVTMGNNVTSIGANAFLVCSKLKSIALPSKLTTIGSEAFRNTGLTSISIPASVMTIGIAAFQDCGSMTSITIEDSETPLTMSGAWYERPLWSPASTIYIGRNLTLTGGEYNSLLSEATSVEFGPKVTTINPSLFYGNTKLTSLTFGSGVTSIGNSAFQECSALTSINIGSAVTTIGDYAFFKCSALTSFTIPASVQTIGNQVFYYVDEMKNFTIEDGSTPLTIGDLGWGISGENFYLGRDVTYTSTLNGQLVFSNTQHVTVGPKVTTLNNNMFYYRDRIKSVDLTQATSLTTIGDWVFYHCDSLENITIPATVTTIGKEAFLFTDRLNNVIFVDGDATLTMDSSIGSGLCGQSMYLGRNISGPTTRFVWTDCKTLTVGPKVTTLYANMFKESALETIDLTNATSLTTLGADVFGSCTKLEEVKVGWLTPLTINDNAFNGSITHEGEAYATLNVPAGTKEAYAAADGWKKFENVAHWSTLVTLTASTHGSIVTAEATASNSTEQYRQPKTDAIVYTLTADEGYELTALTDNDAAVSPLPALGAEQTRANMEGEEFVTLSATFNAINYTIEYELAGGSVASANPESYTIESAAFTLVNPTREGYNFTGWTGTGLDAATKTVTIAAGSTGERSYTATWTPIVYEIAYTLNEGTATNPATYTIESADITLNNPTKTGYTFKGWKLNGEGDAMMSVIIAHGSTGNKAYTATWQINQYTITFDSNGGSDVDPIKQDYNTAVKAPAAPTKTGYTFTGWTPAVPATIPAEDMTVTAQWQINQYTITFDSNGGSDVDPIKQDYNTAVTTPAAPTKKGYSFGGWTPAVPTTMPAENKTLTATWNLVTYTISYELDGGSVATANPTTYNVESAAITLNNPTKTGFDFAGWTGTGLEAATKTVVIATGSTEDRSYTATWTKQKFTVNITGDNVIADNLNPEYGDNVVLTILADEDAELLKLTVDGTDVTASVSAGKYTITNVTANVEVVATWNKTKEYIHMAHSQATFSCKQDLDFTGVEGLKVYVASGFNKSSGKVLMTQIEGKVPAGTGLFLEGTEGVTYKVPYATTCDAYYVSLLKPVVSAQVVPMTEGDGAYTNFLYGEKDGVKGFYKSSGFGTVAAGKAYLQLPSSAVAGIKGIGFEFDDETAISSVKADVVAPEGVYDIKGRKIPAGQKLTRGIYVINGKKVSIK